MTLSFVGAETHAREECTCSRGFDVFYRTESDSESGCGFKGPSQSSGVYGWLGMRADLPPPRPEVPMILNAITSKLIPTALGGDSRGFPGPD